MNVHHKSPGSPVELNRRQFIISALAVGGGLAIGLVSSRDALAAVDHTMPWTETEGTDFTAFITITPDNVVTVRSTAPEIGQGAATAPPMYVTEELYCDWELVRTELIPPNRNLLEGNAYTKTASYFGGRTTSLPRMKEYLQLAASTRERLKAAAAEAWGVPVAEITTEKSILAHAASGRSATYGEFAAAAAGVVLAEEPAPKPFDDWWFVGKQSPRKIHLPALVNGSAKYGIDVQVPGMVYAALRQVPVAGGRLKSYDFDAIKNMPGVRQVVVVDPDEPRPGLPEGYRVPFGQSAQLNGPQAAVAVIADHFYQAQTALDVLPVEWDLGDGQKWTSTQTIYDALFAKLENPAEANIVRDRGDVTAALAGGADLTARYMTPYADHVNMEPLNGTALVTDERADIWIPSQQPQQSMMLLADETGLHPEKCHAHQTWVGVGFGRRVFGDDSRMVAAIANKVRGTPVKVIWSREEAMRQGRYRQIIGTEFSARIGADGYPEAMLINVAGSTGDPIPRAFDSSPYQLAIPNYRVQSQAFDTNLMSGSFRGPVYNSNCFMLETFVNELAEKAGIDAIDYRKTLLSAYADKSWINLLDLVREKSGWDEDDGLVRGVAIGNWGGQVNEAGEPVPHTGTTVAMVSSIELSRRGQLSIPRIDVAIDTGRVVNRDLVTLQVEGGVMLGLSTALYEEINVQNGRVVEGNLDVYQLMRQNDPALPYEIHVHYDAMSGIEHFSEAGEPPVGPVAPALAHAIYRAGGKWLRTEPFSRQGYT